jgi:hypothetical protein
MTARLPSHSSAHKPHASWWAAIAYRLILQAMRHRVEGGSIAEVSLADLLQGTKVASSPLLKLCPVPPAAGSRNQNWKNQVDPALICPLACGGALKSMG